MRIQEPSRRLLVIVLAISFGVSLASYGELHFNIIGTDCLATESYSDHQIRFHYPVSRSRL